MVQAWKLYKATTKQRNTVLQEKRKLENLEWEAEQISKGFSKAAVVKVLKDRQREQKLLEKEEKKQEDIGQLEFIRQVVEVLFKRHAKVKQVPTKARMSSASLKAIRFDTGKHLIYLTKIAGVCKECKGRTKFRCKRCSVALHAECFYKFHGGEEVD